MGLVGSKPHDCHQYTSGEFDNLLKAVIAKVMVLQQSKARDGKELIGLIIDQSEPLVQIFEDTVSMETPTRNVHQ